MPYGDDVVGLKESRSHQNIGEKLKRMMLMRQGCKLA